MEGEGGRAYKRVKRPCGQGWSGFSGLRHHNQNKYRKPEGGMFWDIMLRYNYIEPSHQKGLDQQSERSL